MSKKLNLPSLADLSEDPDGRYSELEKHIRRLMGQIERRSNVVEEAIGKLREQEEIILKQEGIDYEYFGYDQEVKPRYPQGTALETLAGMIFLYNVDDISFNLLAMKMQENLGDRSDIIVKKMELLREIGMCYGEFIDDFAVRYANIIVVGYEDTTSPYGLAYCIGKNDMVMHVHVDAMNGFPMPTHDEEGTLDDYLSKAKQDELIENHAACEHNQYIITHPSDLFDHEILAIASATIIQKRYFDMNPEVKDKADAKAEVTKAQDISSIFGAIGAVTRDPLGIGGSDDDDDMLN